LSISLIFFSVSSSSIRIESFSIRICMMRRRSDCGASGASGSTKSGTSAREYTPASSGILPLYRVTEAGFADSSVTMTNGHFVSDARRITSFAAADAFSLAFCSMR